MLRVLLIRNLMNFLNQSFSQNRKMAVRHNQKRQAQQVNLSHFASSLRFFRQTKNTCFFDFIHHTSMINNIIHSFLLAYFIKNKLRDFWMLKNEIVFPFNENTNLLFQRKLQSENVNH